MVLLLGSNWLPQHATKQQALLLIAQALMGLLFLTDSTLSQWLAPLDLGKYHNAVATSPELMFKKKFESHICIKSNMVIWNPIYLSLLPQKIFGSWLRILKKCSSWLLLAAAEVCIDLFKKPTAGGDDDLMMPHSNATTGA
jgi:hypothetical protein